MKNKLLLIIYLFIIAIITSCGGGGGGGGAVAFQETAQLHNGGGNSGWGKGNQTGGGFNGGEIQSSTLLISQMAALNVTNVRIELTINDVAQTPINADASTTTDVLPKTKVGDKVSGRAYIYVAGESEPRVAELDETEIALSNTLKFKVPYKYRAYGLDSTTQVASGTYFARDGIDLSAHTTSTIAGWQCAEDGTTHYGSVVTGVRGDITLNAVLNTGSITIPDVSLEITEAPSSAVANSNVYRLADLTGNFKVKANPASGSFPVGAKYLWNISKTGGNALPEFEDGDEITITPAMISSLGITSLNDISTSSTNPDTINVTCTVKHDSLAQTEWRDGLKQIKIWRLPTVSATIGNTTLYAAASNSLGQTTITVTGATGTPGTPVVTPTSASSLLTFGTPQQVSSGTYTISVSIASDASGIDRFGKVWFDNNTTVGIQIPDPSGATADAGNVTLKNKYQYTLQGYSSTGAVFFSNVDDGTTVDFSTAVAKYSSVPSGRPIVAFKDTTDDTIYKESDFPITFNSTNFSTRRDITLKAILNFSYSVKDGNDAALTQTGTQADPYILTFGGTGANSSLHVSVPTGEFFGEIGTSFDTSGVLSRSLGSSPYNNPRIGIMNSLTEDAIPSTPVKVTLTDSGTGASRDFYVKVAQPLEYKYSLVYQRGSGASVTNVVITGWQNITFTPNTSLRFGVADGVANLTMGDLDSSLTGLEASIKITGWKSTRASNPPTYNTPFPNVGAADCESDGTITLIATTDYGLLLDAYRQDENAVQNGDIVLSSGLCVNKTFYTNHTSLLNSYVVGSVCIRDGNQKFIVAKNNLSGNYHIKWSNSTNNNSALSVTITGTQTSDSSASMPRYDISSNGITLAFSNSNSGKNSMNSVSINNYPAFKYCNDYGNNFSGSFSSGWYLPSIAEAYALYKNNIITGQWIVSSSQFDTSRYWCLIGNQQILVTRSKTEEDNRSNIYPCHEFTFVAP